MKDRVDYQRDYYKNNREKLKTYRKQKYKSDEEYRKKALVRSRLQNIFKALNNIEQKTVVFNGRKEPVYYLPQVAKLINKDTTNLYTWKNKKYLPEALFKDKKGRGLYTFSQISFLTVLFEKINKEAVKLNYDQLREILKKIWNRPFSMGLLNRMIKEELNKIL